MHHEEIWFKINKDLSYIIFSFCGSDQIAVYIKNMYEVDVTNTLLFRYRRRTYVTPKSYLSFINGYKEFYTEKLDSINEQAERMQTGKQIHSMYGLKWSMFLILDFFRDHL